MFKAMFSNTTWNPPADAFGISDQPGMKFHNVLIFLLCPLWILSWLHSLVDVVRSYTEYQEAGLALGAIYSIAVQLILIVVTATAIAFLFKKRWLGPRLLIYVRILFIVFGFIEIVILQIAVPPSMTMSADTVIDLLAQLIGVILGTLLFLYLVTQYYNRRRLLFSPAPVPSNESHPR